MTSEKKKIVTSFLIPAIFIGLLWIIKLSEIWFDFSLIPYGIYPRTPAGLTGIIVSPLVHSSTTHLFSNTLPLFFLAAGILYFYRESSLKVILMVYFLPGLLVWLFGRSSYHIGASWLIYGFVTYLFFSGIIRRDTRSIALALLVTFLYGSLIWGVLPLNNGISWEGHLFGALTGIISAVLFRKLDPYQRYSWEDEEESGDQNNSGFQTQD